MSLRLGLNSKIKLKMQTRDALTGPYAGYGTKVTVKACGPLVRNSADTGYSPKTLKHNLMHFEGTLNAKINKKIFIIKD